jgi:hypothetical protein
MPPVLHVVPLEEQNVESGLLEFDQESKRWRPRRIGLISDSASRDSGVEFSSLRE